MKIRIYKNSNWTVIYSIPNKMFQGGTFVNDVSMPIYSNDDNEKQIIGYVQKELTFSDCQFDIEFKDFEFIDVDESNIPVSNSNTGDYHEMLYFDGDCKLENLKQDKSWENVLMPSFLVVKKHLKHLDKSLDAELAKDEPDPIVAMKLSQKKEAAKKLDPITNEKELLEIALEGLSRAEISKPLIEEKLNKKITELTSDQPIK